jgi:DNA-binding transcriptional ArsR family regulator
MGSVVRITLDAETFKALASPTRLTVLRALDERRKTLTEISRDLALNKATVHEHLALLATADLVRKRDDEGRKWIYYELTWRGQKLLHPQETTTFNVLLGLGVAAAGGGLGLLARSLYTAIEPHVEAPVFSPAPPAVPIADSNGPARSASTQGTQTATGAPTTASGGSSTSTGTSQPPSAGAPAAGASPTASASTTATPQATTAGASAHGAATATHLDAGTAASHGGLLDDMGTLGLALLAFAALMGLLAWLLRRHLRADPFRPPADSRDT